MGLMAPTKGTGGDWETCPAGNLRAVIVAIIDLGHHYETYKARKPGERDRSGYNHKVGLVFETRKKDTKGQPFYMIQRYTMSLADGSAKGGQAAALRKVYVAVVGPVPTEPNASIMPLLGKPCMLQVERSPDDRFANIKAVTGPYEDDAGKTMETVVKPFAWDIDGDIPFTEPEWMPRIYGQKVADVIGESREKGGTGAKPSPKAAVTNGETAGGEDSEIPF